MRAHGSSRSDRRILTIIRFAILLLAFFAFTNADSVKAIDWERMVMPGPLAGAHEKLVTDCASCHRAFDPTAQSKLCLACHQPIAEDLANEVGFHSQNPLAATGQCNGCHPDHRGPEADIRGLSDATFNHGQTDFPLLGRHQGLNCTDCHLPEIARRDAPGNCIDCHQKDDPHKGKLSTDCADCHSQSQWRETRFDHTSTTYPLTGAHQGAACNGCHVAAEYKGTPSECISCHAIDDAHDRKFGTDCSDCHQTTSWQQKSFDHKRESGFGLTGAHLEARCSSCHHSELDEQKLPETCSGCHSSDDIHAGRFGSQCNSCHISKTWARTKFDHTKQTNFPLLGAHQRNSCSSCHTQKVKSPSAKKNRAETDCYACHRPDDVHQKTLGKSCAECHNENSFSGRIRFDHELTGFPLLGLHAIAPCESCHRDQVYSRKDVSCFECHEVDDTHEQRLGSDCAECHNPNGWMRWRFDHARETTFALDGSHEDLECVACHRTPMTNTTQVASDCLDCHGAEDPHRGSFGRSCNNCHNTAAWKPARFGRRRESR